VLNHLSLGEQAAAVRNRTASPLELVDAHIAELERTNPQINAFIQPLHGHARHQAQQVLSGPLAGVPVTVKDSFDIHGLPTFCGSKLRLHHRADRDSVVVQRLRRAGAIILGKTNTPEFLMNYESDNLIVGRTNNPLDLTRTPGGSSGGESAAIAAYMSAGGIGSDGGGSVRWPAFCCRIVGLKPTPGRISMVGHFPVSSHPAGFMGVAGPMARTVADVRILFDVLKGYDPEDPFSAPVEVAPATARPRIGVWPQFYATPVQLACAGLVAKAATRLSEAGFVVDEFEPRGLERAPNLWAFLFSELSAPFLRDMIDGRRADTHWTGVEMLDMVDGTPEPSGKRVVEILSARDAMRANVLRQMREFPVILTPGAGMEAFPHRSRRYPTPTKEIGLFEGTFPLTWANLLGLPALAVAGVQLVGAPYSDELLLDIGEALTQQ
jgi:amidase